MDMWRGRSTDHSAPTWRTGGSLLIRIFRSTAVFAANGYVVCCPILAGLPAMDRSSAKLSLPTGETKIFRTTWRLWIMRSPKDADPDKIGVGGWSYGGISTDFIIGHTNRFKAAISGAGAAKFTSLWGHDEYLREYVIELGYPWENKTFGTASLRFIGLKTS